MQSEITTRNEEMLEYINYNISMYDLIRVNKVI